MLFLQKTYGFIQIAYEWNNVSIEYVGEKVNNRECNNPFKEAPNSLLFNPRHAYQLLPKERADPKVSPGNPSRLSRNE